MTASERVELSCRIAENLVGYHGHKNASNLWNKNDGTGGEYTLFAEALLQNGYYNGNKQGYDGWCTLGVDFCDLLACGLDKSLADSIFPNGEYGAGAKYSRDYYKAKGREFAEPQPGDRIFYLNADGIAEHVGKVIAVNGNECQTVEFNVTGNLCDYRTVDYTKRKVVFGRPVTDAQTKELAVGDLVLIKAGANVSDREGGDHGYQFSGWVYGRTMYVGEINNVAAHITTDKENADKGIYTGWVRRNDIEGQEMVAEAPNLDSAPAQVIPEGSVIVDKAELDRMEGLLAAYAKENAELKERNGILELQIEKIKNCVDIFRNL